MNLSNLGELPRSVHVFHDGSPAANVAQRKGAAWRAKGTTVNVTPGPAGTGIQIHEPSAPMARVTLRWPATFPATTLFLGDAWERGYGDLQWRHMQPERILPWYFAAHDPASGQTVAAGVKTQAGAMCFWTVDEAGITLWLDLRNGGMPSILGDRVLDAATVVTAVSEAGESPFAVVRRLCGKMCDRPRMAASNVCGNNNWYYAYGKDFDADQVRRDAGLLAELAGHHENRPYCVIDAGWSPGSVCPGGPWTAGKADKFPDMPGLARDITQIGVLPGIWIRPTSLSFGIDSRRLRPGPQNSEEKALDLTMPENLELIRQDIARMREWGYRLIKHDFSTWDTFGRWGHEMGAEPTDPGWHFADRSLTNAEILLRLYQTIRQAAGDAILIGCNTIGHLGAGLFELQRTGDDTSGKLWERTRRMGVNTLAFRLPQQGTFFATDADCVAHTENTPWEKDRQWLDLVARSSTPLFISVDPKKITPEVKSTMTAAMRLALSGGSSHAEPLDWLTNTCPRRWRFDDQTVEYDWTEAGGTWPMKC
jgi:alpha-galactosidase